MGLYKALCNIIVHLLEGSIHKIGVIQNQGVIIR